MKISTIIFFIILTLLCLTRTTLSQNPSPTNWFIITKFQCTSDKTKCDKVKNVINLAGKYITATLNFKLSIKIDAGFLDLCKERKCDVNNNHNIIASASPLMIKFNDTDGKVRSFPLALYKQIRLKYEPGDDIKLIINSQKDYWFRGDPLPMPVGYRDLLFVVIHELIHGLGFTNSWDDYPLKTALRPGFGDSPSQPLFVENIFDKFIVLTQNGKSLLSMTDELNQFQYNLTTYSDQDFINSFSKSPQFSIAQYVYNIANNTRGTMGLLLTSNIQSSNQLSPNQNDILLLETSILFNNGSSIGHVDMQTYNNTSDFLMVYSYTSGETLDDKMEKTGSTNTTGPIGPNLRRFLGVLGYDVKQSYTPPDINIGIHISFNLLLSFVCILLNIINFF
ncbi:unnamed protein product [Rhizophagus irregularis]|nr:unnamed protein product [Rhizophagus irregularis]CAB5388291.1 unnamed protein product [Rhizophagus irregularis]